MQPNMHAELVRACRSLESWPDTELPEVAIAGRSNCGKSSLINALTGHSHLARSSSTPGRTREIVFFQLKAPGIPPFQLVDLPGYGYARVSRQEQRSWAPMVDSYIETRPQLALLLVLNDLRRKLAQQERDLLAWAAARGLTAWVVFTKADKVGKSKQFGVFSAARNLLDGKNPAHLVSTQDPPAVQRLRQAMGQQLFGAKGLPPRDPVP